MWCFFCCCFSGYWSLHLPARVTCRPSYARQSWHTLKTREREMWMTDEKICQWVNRDAIVLCGISLSLFKIHGADGCVGWPWLKSRRLFLDTGWAGLQRGSSLHQVAGDKVWMKLSSYWVAEPSGDDYWAGTKVQLMQFNAMSNIERMRERKCILNKQVKCICDFVLDSVSCKTAQISFLFRFW